MQLIPRYILKNRINIVVPMFDFITENDIVYQRNLKIYQGIINIFQFRLYNPDQKPVDSSNYTPVIVFTDSSNNEILRIIGTSLDDGSSQTKGLISFEIPENKLLDVTNQFLKYVVYLVDSNNAKVLTYSDRNFAATGTAEILKNAFPEPRDANEITQFKNQTLDNIEYFISDPLEIDTKINQTNHTIAVYAQNFSNELEIQGSLENQLSNEALWTTIIKMNIIENSINVTNFTGVFNWIRIKGIGDFNEIQKIQIKS